MMNTLKLPELVARALSASSAALLVALVPKCPLCIAAYLTAFGLGAGAASSAAPFVRPLAFALAGITCSMLVLAVWRKARRRDAFQCCGG